MITKYCAFLVVNDLRNRGLFSNKHEMLFEKHEIKVVYSGDSLILDLKTHEN